jgi:hypothetical protein
MNKDDLKTAALIVIVAIVTINLLLASMAFWFKVVLG